MKTLTYSLTYAILWRMIRLSSFYTNIIQNFCIAFGVVIGGSIFSGIGAILTNNPPLRTMVNIASSIKIWAVAIALGGTFSSFKIIDKGILEGEIKSIIKQLLYILIALLGANLGYAFIKLFQRSSELWLK